MQAQTDCGGMFNPVMDGQYLPHDPWDPVAPEESADIPVIVSTTLEDAALALTNFDLDPAGLRAIVERRYPGKADEIIALYHKLSPEKSPFLGAGGNHHRRRRAPRGGDAGGAQGGAGEGAGLYVSLGTRTLGGKFGAVHGLDVGATFKNDRAPIRRPRS